MRRLGWNRAGSSLSRDEKKPCEQGFLIQANGFIAWCKEKLNPKRQ